MGKEALFSPIVLLPHYMIVDTDNCVLLLPSSNYSSSTNMPFVSRHTLARSNAACRTAVLWFAHDLQPLRRSSVCARCAFKGPTFNLFPDLHCSAQTPVAQCHMISYPTRQPRTSSSRKQHALAGSCVRCFLPTLMLCWTLHTF